MGRIAKNTAALFVRQMVMALISLYTIRVLLTQLGISDFGLLNVTYSVVMLGTFVTSSLGMITQRYISYAIGEQDEIKVKRYHDACLAITLFSGLVVFLVAQTAGAWFVANELVVEPGRKDTVLFLYQFLILSFVINLIVAFHSWLVVAHEDMHVFAQFSIAAAVLRLGAAIGISYIEADGLRVYGPLLAASGSVIMVAQWSWCALRYEECRFGPLRVDFTTIREMLGFVGWTLFGQFTTVCRTQMITILINQGFNPATVAARALSFTIYYQVQTFSQNFTSALNPPIIKAYAAGNSAQTFTLIYFGSKLAFFLSWLVTLPLIALLPRVLTLWLGEYPEETVIFTRLALVEGVVLSISFPLMTAVRAVGKMRTYELLLGSLQILLLVVSWMLVRAGFPAYSVFLAAIVVNLAMFGIRLALASCLLGMPATSYLHATLFPVFAVVTVSLGLTAAVLWLMPSSVSFIALLGALAIIVIPALSVILVGFSPGERSKISDFIRQKFATKRPLS